MNSFILALLAIMIPFLGAFLSLFFSQLEEYIDQEGKVRDWLVVILILIPTIIVTSLFLPRLHVDQSINVFWFSNTIVGLQTNELSKIFSIFISISTTVIAIFSISFLSNDKARGSFWFFLLLTLSGIMLGIFANNLYWMFGGFEVATIAGFFLISHFYRKSGEGLKVGKTGIRFFIFTFIGDIILLICFALIIKAFGSPNLEEIFHYWSRRPKVIIGGSSAITRLLISVLLILGVLIKSAQFPLLLWPLGGENKDIDLNNAPLPVIPYLVTITLGSMGLFIISNFYPLFANRGLEYYFKTELFNQTPFVLLGWIAIFSMIIALVVLLSTESIHRIVTALAIIQMGTCYLSLSSANDLGLFAAFIHLVSSTPAILAITIVFGMMIESLRMKSIGRLKGLGNQFPILKIFSLLACLSFLGVFPFGVYFTRDMIFSALISSTISSKIGLLIVFIIILVFTTFGVVKSFMKTLFGEIDEDLSIRMPGITSTIMTGIVLLWTTLFGIITVSWGYPTTRASRGFFNYPLTFDYDFPIFSNWVISPIVFVLIPIVFIFTCIVYRDGFGKVFENLRKTQFYLVSKKVLANIFYYEYIFDYILLKPINFLSKYISWTRLKAPTASVIWAVLSVIILISIMVILGGGM